jgi:anaerobic ribonucleoside-triphosphate reductase activating protein
MEIRVAGTTEESVVDGPGVRFVVFVQGCSLHCEECHNLEAQPRDGGVPVEIQSLVERILSQPRISGLTLSGGEPFEQASACLHLIRELRKKAPEFHVIAYSGYTLEQLAAKEDPDIPEILRCINTLIDGPFIQSKRTLNHPYVGSSNQRIIQNPAAP